MASRMKPGAKIALIGIAVVAAFFLLNWYLHRPRAATEATKVGTVVLPDAPEASLSGSSAVKLPLPSGDAVNNGGVTLKAVEMAWNSQTSFNYANGGPNTTKGSLLDKAGFNVQIVRQDDCGITNTDMISWIKDYHDGKTKDGYISIFMATGEPNYFHAVSKAVEALGAEYQPVIFMTSGKSFGEDQLIGDVSIKNNPQLLRGSIVRGVALDGDLDVAIKFAGDNGIPVNANGKQYDPTAMNLSFASTYLTAVTDYNSHMKETRKVVVNGVRTSKDTTVEVNMVATWTPGDVNAVEGAGARGGATIISTKQYASIMPNMFMTCRKFLNDNREKMQDFIAAVATAGDQVRSFEDAKKKACDINAKIWNEQDGNYWYKLYTGRKSGDAYLGGSMVYNLNDMNKIFGATGGTDVFKEIYTLFGKLQMQIYSKKNESPMTLDEFTDYSKVVDKSLIASVVSNHPELLSGQALKTVYKDTITSTVASRNVQINFAFGSSNIDPSSTQTLDDIYSSAVAAEGLTLGVYGHTDNVGGNSDANVALSLARANAVKSYLVTKGLDQARIVTKGYGASQPLSSSAAVNNSDAGRAKNRRVQIVLGQ